MQHPIEFLPLISLRAFISPTKISESGVFIFLSALLAHFPLGIQAHVVVGLFLCGNPCVNDAIVSSYCQLLFAFGKLVKKNYVIHIIDVFNLRCYYISKRTNCIFNNPDKLQQEINRIGKGYQKKIDELKEQFDKIETLQKELIQSFKYSEEHLAAFLSRETIQAHKPDESFLKFTLTLFEEAVSIYQLDIKKIEEQKVKTLFDKKNKEYAEKLGKKINSEGKKNEFLAAKNLAEGKVATLTKAIEELEGKIKLLTNIDLAELDIKFVDWKSDIENPFKENQEKLFQKYKTTLKDSNDSKALDKSLLELAGTSGGYKNEISSIKKLIPILKAAFDNQDKEYKKHFKKPFDKDELIPKITDDDLKAFQKAESETDRDYKNKYDTIVQHFTAELRDNPVMQNHEYHFNQMLFQLIPQQLITNKEKPEESLLNDIENILADLNQKIQLLNEEETRKIHSTIHTLKDIVEKHLGDLEKIQTHFKEFKLANHHSVSLEFGVADDFDLNWIRKFKDDSQEASFLKSFGFKTNESAHTILERIFKQYCPTIKEPKAHEILDPFNYYDAKAKLIDSTGTQKAATGGTGYGLLALIGIAKLSVVEGKKNIKDIKKGIRILPVDEVAGLGGIEGFPLSEEEIDDDDEVHLFVRWVLTESATIDSKILQQNINIAYETVFERANTMLDNSDSVLILGKDKGEGLKLLKRIQTYLEELGYYTYIIKEQPDKIGESVMQKVLNFGLSSRFVIIENTKSSGHLYEFPYVTKLAELTCIILQQKGKGATWMFEDLYHRLNNIKKFEYSEKSLEKQIDTGIKWADKYRKSFAKYQKKNLPWFKKSNLKYLICQNNLIKENICS